MAREGVSFVQVQAAAEALVAEGRLPSIRAVREQLRGTGSPNTIHKHLTKWREALPQAPGQAIELPSSILREIHGEIARAAQDARAESHARLAQVQTEAADLAAAGEALEAERDGLLEQLAALVRERDSLADKLTERDAEVLRLGQDIERERRAAEEARIEVAQARLRTESETRARADQTAEISQLRAELAQERNARTDAQRDQAAAKAAWDGLADRLADLQARERAAQQAAAELRDRLDTQAHAAQHDAAEIARLGAEVKAAQQALEREAGESLRSREESMLAHPAASTPAVKSPRRGGRE